MENNVFILTGLIQTGKTTSLLRFIRENRSAGFLTPDIDGKRKLYSIADDRYYEMQTDESDNAEMITIGRFLFRKDAFETGNKIMNGYSGDADWFIVDEAGPLEVLLDNGFEPALSDLVRRFKEKEFNGKLLVVVREKLLEQAKEKYGITAIVLSPSEL